MREHPPDEPAVEPREPTGPEPDLDPDDAVDEPREDREDGPREPRQR
jgi:hypothetical protein